MKHLKTFAALCCMAAVFAACEKNNVGSVTGTENGHDYVDLGLPSGTKWANLNIGATTPEDYGDYFAWGETNTKSTYSLDTYTYTDNKPVLELADDAAYINWGGAWRMPTDAEWQELRDNCTWTWTTLNGINGVEVKGSNGNAIFLPAAGSRENGDFYGANDYGCYWSSSLSTSNYYSESTSAYCMEFDPYGVDVNSYTSRNNGCSVRAVCN